MILISLMMSWFTAVTITPLFCCTFLKVKSGGGPEKDPYGGKFYQGYKTFLSGAIRRRWVTVGVIVAIVLFIDPIGRPLSPTSRAGVHRRHVRRAVRRRF